MVELLRSLGRGFINILISLFVGTGVGMVAFGVSARNRPGFWEDFSRGPSAEFFLGVGSGMLTAGMVMIGLFCLPRKRPSSTSPLKSASEMHELS